MNRAFIRIFRHWIAFASVSALLVVLGAAATSLVAASGHHSVAQLAYWAYRPLCPQRAAHSFFIRGHKMAFEQRETAMFLAAAVSGPLYVLLQRGGWRMPGRLAVASMLPMLIDVATQVVGLRTSDGFWRSLTGGLAVICVLLWAYPQIDTDLRRYAVPPPRTTHGPVD